MQHAEIELLLNREMPHTGHKRLPERPIIRPLGKDFVDGRIVEGVAELWICYSLTEEETCQAECEESNDYPSAALPLLPRERYCQAWSVP